MKTIQHPPAAPGAPVIQNTVIVNGKPAPAPKGCVRRAVGCLLWIVAAVAVAGIIAGVVGRKSGAPSADAPAPDAAAGAAAP